MKTRFDTGKSVQKREEEAWICAVPNGIGKGRKAPPLRVNLGISKVVSALA